MTLTDNGKRYIAYNFGIGQCFVSSGLNYTFLGIDNVTYTRTNEATAQVVGKLTSGIGQSVTINGNTYTNTMLTSANGEVVTTPDTQLIAQNDGSPVGEPQYCYTCSPPSCSFTIN